jgi:hypothetical protein
VTGGTPLGTKMSTGRIYRAPFIDPVTGIAYDTNNSEFEGYLTKQSLWLRVSQYQNAHVASPSCLFLDREPSIGMPNDIRDLVLMPSAYTAFVC